MPINVGTLTTVKWSRPTGHTVTLAVTKPDGTLLNPAPAVSEEGALFSAEVPCDFAGRYLLHWQDTTDTAHHADILDVWPTDPRYLISLEDAANALKWGTADKSANLDTLAIYVAAATEVIEDITGAILIRTIVQPADGGRTGVALWERPSSIESVTVNGSAAAGFVPNLNAGIVYADGSGGRFATGVQNIVITYRTGAEDVPPTIRLAARELVRHLWQLGQQQGAAQAPPPTPNPQQTGMTRSGFAVPNRVIELCGSHYSLPGIA